MNNTLIDNSTEQLSMLSTLKECLALQDINTVKIATGYWDIPGLALLTDEIKDFLEKYRVEPVFDASRRLSDIGGAVLLTEQL